ncbi:MAG: XRE family transcriptional regulator [Bacillota bacterium]|nr:XRE family transcriptional regulator [Bacillota bacterium]
MNSEVMNIPKRIYELRDILGISASEVAQKLLVSEETYLKYESGELDIPISALYEIAEVLNVDPTVLLTGESPRMNSYSVTRKGKGVSVMRHPGYNYQSLSYNFAHRNMDPLLVTIDEDDKPKLVVHSGQEFNYVLEGKIKLTLGEKEIILSEGDSVFFDPSIPHGQSSVEGRSVFLTVIKE